MSEMIFAGEKELGVCCLRALQKEFSKLSIMRVGDENILALKRESDTVIDSFIDSDAKYVFLASWYPLIKETELQAKRFINIHSALLPKYRGMHSIFWAIMNFEVRLGYTIHEVNKNVDDGDIIYQYGFCYDEQTVGEIYQIFYEDLNNNLADIILRYISGEIVPVKQDRTLATWVPRRRLADCIINFNWSNKMLRRFFLALTPPYPLPRIVIRGIPYEVVEHKVINKSYFCDNGIVVNIDEDGVWIKTEEGLLVVSLVKHADSLQTVDPKKLLRIGYRFKYLE